MPNASSTNGKLLNSYSLTVDVKLDSLPGDCLTVLQTKGIFLYAFQ